MRSGSETASLGCARSASPVNLGALGIQSSQTQGVEVMYCTKCGPGALGEYERHSAREAEHPRGRQFLVQRHRLRQR